MAKTTPPASSEPAADKNTPEDKKKEFSDKLRSSIQESLQNAREGKRRELFARRVELAKAGLSAYDNKQLAEATRAFHSYLVILEDWKGVGDGGLHPKHFDSKIEMPELLLLSGIYWDLAKIYDQAKNKERQKDFTRYLEKFVTFSKGFPYEVVCRETLRKYLMVGRIVHRSEFEDAYKRLGGSNCLVATALSDELDGRILYELRSFRKEFLELRPWGKWISRIYYRWSPPLAQFLLMPANHSEICGFSRGAQYARLFLRRFLIATLNRLVAILTSCRFVPGGR